MCNSTSSSFNARLLNLNEISKELFDCFMTGWEQLPKRWLLILYDESLTNIYSYLLSKSGLSPCICPLLVKTWTFIHVFIMQSRDKAQSLAYKGSALMLSYTPQMLIYFTGSIKPYSVVLQKLCRDQKLSRDQSQGLQMLGMCSQSLELFPSLRVKIWEDQDMTSFYQWKFSSPPLFLEYFLFFLGVVRLLV